MGETLAHGNMAIALLGNTLPTGAMLIVIITIFEPISGAHFNPAVTLAFFLKREISLYETAQFTIVQILGAIIGVWAAHFMFAEDFFRFR